MKTTYYITDFGDIWRATTKTAQEKIIRLIKQGRAHLSPITPKAAKIIIKSKKVEYIKIKDII